MSSQSSTIVSVQYLRALAAAMVLLEHISKKSGQVGHEIFSWLHFGYTGVDVFFVISGFIMCFIYMRSRSGVASLGDFWRRRFIRIMPLYWTLTFLALCVYLIAPEKINSSGGETVVWQSFFLLPGEGQRFLIANGWTLSYEMYFYALLSLSFLVPNKALGAFASIVLVCLIVGSGFVGLSLGRFLANPFLLEFVFGMLVYLLYRQRSSSGVSYLGLLCLGFGAIGLAAQQFTTSLVPDRRFLTAGVPAAFLVFGVVLNEGPISRVSASWLEKLGNSSYSMYLFHPFPLKAAGLLFAYFGFAALGAWFEWLYWVVTAGLVLATSYYVYVYLELPLISWVTRLVRRRSANVVVNAPVLVP
jgi:exopolysaccharide production protein ExoZ